MTKRPKDNTVGPWAREKLEALRRYLDFYTTVLKKQGHWLRGTIYVDAFAGPGFSTIRTKQTSTRQFGLFSFDPKLEAPAIEFLKGSPRVALEIANPFSSYIFIEQDPKRIAELEALKAEYQERAVIEIKQGDANSELQKWVGSGIDWKHHRAIVFLDPFGMQMAWSTIGMLARTRKIEVIINFPLDMAIQRLLTRTGKIPKGWQISLDTFFGSRDWRKLVYEEEADLFGPKTCKVDDAGAKLIKWYRHRLHAIFRYVSTARLIRNTRGNPLYYLIWAGPHEKGLKGAEYILSMGEHVKR